MTFTDPIGDMFSRIRNGQDEITELNTYTVFKI